MALELTAINLDDRARYQSFLDQCPQVASDYSFVNLWGWADHYGLKWAWDEGLVWIHQTVPIEACWAPVGNWHKIDWVACFNRCFEDIQHFSRVPDVLAENWHETPELNVTVHEERGHWDYLYDREELTLLRGNRFHKKKNLLNQFVKKYDFVYAPLGKNNLEAALALQEDWCIWRDCESSDVLAAENQAISKVLSQWDMFDNLFGGALMVEGAMVAYTVAEKLTGNTLLIHFEKGAPEYRGVYQAINQQFVARADNRYTLVNREQDLDEPGLRKSKMSYHPVDFIKKSAVTLTRRQ